MTSLVLLRMFPAFRFRCVLLCVVFLTTAPVWVCAQPAGEVSAELRSGGDEIRINGYAEGVLDYRGLKIRVFRGGVELTQQDTRLTAQSLVAIDEIVDGTHQVRVYAEGGETRNVQLIQSSGTRSSASRTLELTSGIGIESIASDRVQLDRPDALIRRAMTAWFPDHFQPVSQVSLQVNPELYIPPQEGNAGSSATAAGRRIQIRPRSSQPLQFEMKQSQDTIPEEQVYVITGGVNVLVEGVAVEMQGQIIRPGVIDLSADRIVIWTPANQSEGLESGMTIVQPSSANFQVYLEGNILIRHQNNTVTASHAFFDVTNDRALLMNAELKAQIPSTGGVFRVRAERLRQLSRDRFHAQNAWTTTSPYGKPGYRIQASDIFVEPGAATPWAGVDPVSGRINTDAPAWVTAVNSQFIVGDTPLLWLPKVSGPIEDPGIPLRRATVKHDRVFGLQVKTVWDLTKIMNINAPRGLEWDLQADYLSDRGPGLGTTADYDLNNHLGRVNGGGTLYYQYDDGRDNLGLGRRRLNPESNSRGEITWQHRQQLPGNAMLFGEIGYLSDRNYLEQYHETRFDEAKDVETILGARQDSGAYSAQIWTRPALYEFDTTTEWLPRADLYSFSQPLLNGLAYWSSHSSLGYAHLDPATAPSDLSDPFTPFGMSYVRDAQGLVAMTRHEVDAPFMLGPVNIDPFVMGEAAFWEEGLTSDNIDRFVLNAGVRAKLFATKIMPFVRSSIFNLNGLAHKSETSLEYSFTDSTRNLSEIAQYNEINENSQERFAYRYTTQIYPGLIPAEFDPRFYAVRNGAGLWTSAPYHELVDDQQVVRLVSRNRLQTKVGPPQSPRIRDWMLWETGMTYFPDAARDNFGEDIGLIFGNYRWNISDRTSILADGTWDVFGSSQKYWNVGLLSQRSTRGSVYMSFRHVEAEDYFESETLTASYSYQMSPKWISTASMAYDVAEKMSRGTSVTLSRVGLDWIFHMGVGVDTSKDNVGIAIALEPRFGPPSPTNLGYLLGLQNR